MPLKLIYRKLTKFQFGKIWGIQSNKFLCRKTFCSVGTLVAILGWIIFVLKLCIGVMALVKGMKRDTNLEFALAYNLYISNTYFQNNREYLITFKSGPIKVKLIFSCWKRMIAFFCKNCKVNLGQPIVTQHRLLILNILFKGVKNHKALKIELTIK